MTIASTLLEWWYGDIDEKAAEDLIGVETFAKLKEEAEAKAWSKYGPRIALGLGGSFALGYFVRQPQKKTKKIR